MSTTAVEALRELAVRWANVNHLAPRALLAGGRLISREARARDQLCFVMRSLVHAPDELIGEALVIPWRSVMRCRHRFWARHQAYPAVESLTALMVRAIARDAQFIRQLTESVAASVAEQTARANRARSDALFEASLRYRFNRNRMRGLRAYFQNGGRQALAARSRGNRWAAKERHDG